jgi:hypothetical protein
VFLGKALEGRITSEQIANITYIGLPTLQCKPVRREASETTLNWVAERMAGITLIAVEAARSAG